MGQQLEAYVAKLVESARYGSKSEVLREGVRLNQDREAQLNALDAVIARSLSDAKASIERDEAGEHTTRHPRQCPDASSSVRCFVSGAHAIDTIIPTSSTPASANIVA
ncbi:type II toxin-antitoxin system ParD family antitoxin [Burkholderia aenigmatica]|uniref:type II toxin-antitoxin system ParD family antitoxin n=1 Tax=Burkholderia aenigmatica TaxID=2015348 RepID=UPI003F689B9C